MTQRNNGGPSCPKTERLEELIDFISGLKAKENSFPGEESKAYNDAIQEVVEALDWTHTMLSNRKVYQKKQQIGKKIYMDLAKELLSADELAALKQEAARKVAEAVANGK